MLNIRSEPLPDNYDINIKEKMRWKDIVTINLNTSKGLALKNILNNNMEAIRH